MEDGWGKFYNIQHWEQEKISRQDPQEEVSPQRHLRQQRISLQNTKEY